MSNKICSELICILNCKMLLAASCLLLLQVTLVFSETYEISEGVFSFTEDGNYVSMFVVTGEGVMVVEPVSTKHATAMLEAIREITDEPVKYLFYSHNHWDHASGGQVFKDAGATIIAHEEAFFWLERNPGPETIVPDEAWSGDRNDITLGAVTLELHYFGANHGLGNTAFLLSASKVAYIADNVAPNRVGYAILPDFDIRPWEQTLQMYLDLDFEKAIYTHNMNPEPIKGGDKEDVVDMIEFLQDLRAAIIAEKEKGTNEFSIPGLLKFPKYEKWALYDLFLEMNIWAVLLDESMGTITSTK